jgi:hypothetical protein
MHIIKETQILFWSDICCFLATFVLVHKRKTKCPWLDSLSYPFPSGLDCKCLFQGENVRHNVGCRTRNLDAIFVAWRKCFTCSISYCKDNIKFDSASNAPKCPLSNDVSIVQKHVVKLSNSSTMFSQQVKIT